MVGQNKIKKDLEYLWQSSKLPHFIIITGKKGSGKKTICKWFAKMSNDTSLCYELPDVKVDTIRQMIEDANAVKERTVMIIPDADTMSLSSKNAILKIVEEPPENITFLMTLEDINNTLPTIKSRAVTFSMDIYMASEIEEICKEQGITDDLEIYKELCEVPGEVEILRKCGPKNLVEFCQKVKENIWKVEPANAFKSSSQLAIKKDDEGFDLCLFWKCFINLCLNEHNIDGVKITSIRLRELNKIGVNKQQLYDMWVLEIRQAWCE